MSTCSQFPPSPQEKNVGKGQGSGGNVTSLPISVPAVFHSDLTNAVDWLEKEPRQPSSPIGLAMPEGFTESFPHAHAAAIHARAYAFWQLRTLPELAVYDLAFTRRISPYDRALPRAIASMPLVAGQTPLSIDVLEEIERQGLTYRSVA